MVASTLIRWGGLTAAAAAALFIITDLRDAFVVLTQGSIGDTILRELVAAVAGVLLSLGLVALYVPQSENTGVPGLVGFLVAYVGVVLTQTGLIWAPLLASIGWAVFGVASLRAQVFPRAAAIVLIVGAVFSALAYALVSIGMFAGSPWYVIGLVIVDAILQTAVAWLGFSLFRGREAEAR